MGAHVVAWPERAVGVEQELRHQEERNALVAGGGLGQSRQHQKDEVVGGAWMPSLCSIEWARTSFRGPSEPSALSRNFGTRKSEMPLLPAGASGNRASTKRMRLSAGRGCRACARSNGRARRFVARASRRR